MLSHHIECYVTQCHVIESSNTNPISTQLLQEEQGWQIFLAPPQVQVQVQDQHEEEDIHPHRETGDKLPGRKYGDFSSSLNMI